MLTNNRIFFLTLLFAFFAAPDVFAQPANDDCIFAQALTIPSSGNICITSSNATATSDNFNDACDTGAPGNEVWFTYIATGSLNTVSVSPYGNPAADALIVTIRNTNCSSGTYNTCAGEMGSNTATAQYTYTPGEQIWISVETNGFNGGFELCISSVSPSPVPGSSCLTASSLCNKDGFSLNIFPDNNNAFTPSCFTTSLQRPVFYKFTAGVSGTCAFTITPHGPSEYDWAMVDITSGCPGTQIACNSNYANASGASCGMQNGAGTCSGEFCDEVTLLSGRTYVIIIDNFTDNNIGFDFIWGGTFQIAPIANFIANPVSGCSPVTTSISNTSTAASGFQWNFGDGTTSTALNPPSHTYSNPGTYLISLVATSSTGCTDIASQLITVNGPVNVVAGSNSPVCEGSSINLTTTSVGGASYSWTGPNGFTSTSQNPVIASATSAMAGTYTVTTSVNGCSGPPQSVNVIIKQRPTITAGSNSPICEGNTLNLNSSTGVPGANYSWSGPNGFSSSNQNPSISSANTSASGTYSVTATVNGCTSIPVYVNVSINTIPVINTNSNSPVCEGNILSLSVSPVNGATYSWSGPNNFASSAQNPIIPSAGMIDSGTYTVIVSNNGCNSSPATLNAVVNNLPSVSAGSNSPVCIGDTILFSSSTVTNGIYNWTGPNGFTSSSQNPFITSASSPDAGTYELNVSANGCVSNPVVINVSVNSGSNPVINAAGPFCMSGSIVNLSASISGGIWNGNGIVDSLMGKFNPATAGTGTHIISYSIAGSCGGSDTVSINVLPAANATINPAGPFCTSDSPVNLSAAEPGGTWYGNGITDANAGTFNPTMAGVGTHTITYIISGQCGDSRTLDIVIDQPGDATINPAGPFCSANPNSVLAAITPGGTWSGVGIVNAGTGEFSPSQAGAGTHIITYTLNGGCSSYDTIHISVIQNADATINPAGPFCILDSPINLTSVQSGGVWSGLGIINSALGTFNPNLAGAGTHVISYALNGACGDVHTINLVVQDVMNSSVVPAGPFCIDSPPLNLTAQSPGGIWIGNGITNSSTGMFSPAAAGVGSHTISYEISGQCGNTSTIDVIVNPLPVVTFSVFNSNGCAPLNVTFQNTTPNSAACVWMVDTSAIHYECGNFSKSFTDAGCFDISLHTIDNNGCANTVSVPNLVCVKQGPTAGFDMSSNIISEFSPSVSFFNTSTDAEESFWNFSGYGTSSETNPVFNFPVAFGAPTVCLRVTDDEGCADSICQTLEVNPEFLLYVPNAFSPNDDGINDDFFLSISGYEEDSFEFLIYNRDGQVIFKSFSPVLNWDGKFNNEPSEEGVYIWRLKVKRINAEKPEIHSGHITLLR